MRIPLLLADLIHARGFERNLENTFDTTMASGPFLHGDPDGFRLVSARE